MKVLMHALAASCEELRARTGNPPLRAVRRALAKSISELASDWLVLTPDIVFSPCFYGIRLWIWPEPLVAPRVRRALGTRMETHQETMFSCPVSQMWTS